MAPKSATLSAANLAQINSMIAAALAAGSNGSGDDNEGETRTIAKMLAELIKNTEEKDKEAGLLAQLAESMFESAYGDDALKGFNASIKSSLSVAIPVLCAIEAREPADDEVVQKLAIVEAMRDGVMRPLVHRATINNCVAKLPVSICAAQARLKTAEYGTARMNARPLVKLTVPETTPADIKEMFAIDKDTLTSIETFAKSLTRELGGKGGGGQGGGGGGQGGGGGGQGGQQGGYHGHGGGGHAGGNRGGKPWLPGGYQNAQQNKRPADAPPE